MCGICGIIHDDPLRGVERNVLEAMNRTLIHRGPDDEGYFYGRGSGLAVRRLSIIDVEGGHQPMSSEDGLIYAICNGEIYNYRELRRELQRDAHTFLTNSDVEVLPHLYEDHGENLISKLNGMFGLAVWDEKRRTLIIARDRMGEKSLYWMHRSGVFLFGSELKALFAHPSVEALLDKTSLAKYLAYEYVPAPHTIVEDVHKLEPGHYLVLKEGRVTVHPYWDIPVDGSVNVISESDAVLEFKRLLELSVKRRLLSDVPLGVFLSGGIDSSSIVSTMTRVLKPADVKTFSISFAEKSFDESDYSKKVATHFGTDHHEEKCTPNDLINLMPEILGFMDEPLGDASIVPTFAISRFARKHVTVALGGDGGDELFAGYPTFQAEKISGIYRMLPGFIRRGLIEPLAHLMPVSDDNMSFDFKVRQFLKGAHVGDLSRHIIWSGSFSPGELSRLLTFDVPDELYGDLSRHVNNAGKTDNRLLYLYKKLYMAEDVLTKVDRASMAASLETRSPFLDHELVEFVARLPYEMKLKGFKMKYLLKKAMAPELPAGIANRPKKGFGIPVAKWFKGPLKKTLLETLSVDRIRKEGLFKPAEVLKLVKDHVEGRADNRKKLWTLFMFENWMERWG